MMKNYVEVAYQEEKKPYGTYTMELAKHLVDIFHLDDYESFLDCGCGRGEMMYAFKEMGYTSKGIDISDFCKDTIIVNFETDSFPFPDNTFDIVFSKSVLEHISNAENYMAEMKRVLKPGGRLILLVPDWETQYKIFYYDPTHVHPYTKQSIEALLHMYEYKEIVCEKLIQLPSVWKRPLLKGVCCFLQMFGPVKKIYKHKFHRWSRELMVLGTGKK